MLDRVDRGTLVRKMTTTTLLHICISEVNKRKQTNKQARRAWAKAASQNLLKYFSPIKKEIARVENAPTYSLRMALVHAQRVDIEN